MPHNVNYKNNSRLRNSDFSIYNKIIYGLQYTYLLIFRLLFFYFIEINLPVVGGKCYTESTKNLTFTVLLI